MVHPWVSIIFLPTNNTMTINTLRIGLLRESTSRWQRATKSRLRKLRHPRVRRDWCVYFRRIVKNISNIPSSLYAIWARATQIALRSKQNGISSGTSSDTESDSACLTSLALHTKRRKHLRVKRDDSLLHRWLSKKLLIKMENANHCDSQVHIRYMQRNQGRITKVAL